MLVICKVVNNGLNYFLNYSKIVYYNLTLYQYLYLRVCLKQNIPFNQKESIHVQIEIPLKVPGTLTNRKLIN